MKIGIIGHGFVGRATAIFGETEGVEVLCYDLRRELCQPEGTGLRDVVECEVVFVCVPTPMSFNGACNLEYVNEAVSLLREERCKAHIVIRSTVAPGTTRRLGCHFMPEFLTEATPEADFRATPCWVVGVNDHLPAAPEFREAMEGLFEKACAGGVVQNATAAWLNPEEAEVVKYSRNAYLAAKVGIANEIATYCERIGVDYEKVRENVGRDPRIGPSHMAVPGPDGKRGFGGTCLMKDLTAFCTAMDGVGASSFILRPVLGRNARRDRPDEVWIRPEKPIIWSREDLEALTLGQIRRLCEKRGLKMETGVEREELHERILKHQTDEVSAREKAEEEKQAMEELQRRRQQAVPAAPPVQSSGPVGNPFVSGNGAAGPGVSGGPGVGGGPGFGGPGLMNLQTRPAQGGGLPGQPMSRPAQGGLPGQPMSRPASQVPTQQMPPQQMAQMQPRQMQQPPFQAAPFSGGIQNPFGGGR